jgi:serine/threonine-protein kinase
VTRQLTKIADYDIVSVLQRGARATIYLATRADLDGDIVLKVTNEFVGGDVEWPTRDLADASRLLHRHIVRVMDLKAVDGVPYIAMERLHGRTLRQLMTDSAYAADVSTRADLIAQLCLGLHHAHEYQIVHGNLTPDNVFITDEGAVKILNFGTTSTDDRTVVSEHARAGSFEYMSPEQIIGRDAIDGRSDVFSAGLLLYELVAGNRPFHAGSTPATLARILREDPAPLEGLDRLNSVVRRALEKEPGRRFSTAQELAYALWMLDLPELQIEEESQAVPIMRRSGYGDQDSDTAPQPVLAPPPPPPRTPQPESLRAKLSGFVRRFWPR